MTTDRNTQKDKHAHAKSNARAWLGAICELAEKLNDTDEADDDAVEKAREEIQEGPLSVQVRGGWHNPGNPEGRDAEEYEILLSTGGPALRIIGDLDRGEPDDCPRLQWQDWFTPWTDYPLEAEGMEAVQTYARQFYFGD